MIERQGLDIIGTLVWGHTGIVLVMFSHRDGRDGYFLGCVTIVAFARRAVSAVFMSLWDGWNGVV